jgi:hypothetical protein
MTDRPRRASDVRVTREEYEDAVAAHARIDHTKRYSDADVAAMVAKFKAGTSYTQIAKAYSCSSQTVNRLITAELPEEVPGMPLTAGRTRGWLGQPAIDWAIHHPRHTTAMKHTIDAVGEWNAQTGIVILLALAQEAHRALIAQTLGAPPTMRTALYWLMANRGLTKAAYEPLSNHTATARKGDVLPRDFWADSEPSTVTSPIIWTLASALQARFRHIGRPSDPLARTGHVFGVVTETRGAAPALTGAIFNELDFEIPVWHTGGMGSLPRRLHIEQQMLAWAERTGCEPHLLVVTDYDPSGLIIANAVADEVRDVDVERIGMLPDQAPSATLTSSGIKEPDENDRHRTSGLWKAAVVEHSGVDECSSPSWRTATTTRWNC